MDGASALESLVLGVARFLASTEAAGIAVWVLAFVFAISGTSKIRRPLPAAVALVDFGVARSVRQWRGSTLGVAETALAVWLASGFARPVALFAALLLLATFVFLISRALVRGETFECACFGESTSTLSAATLVRSGLLLTLTAASVSGAGAATSIQGSLLEAVAAASLLGTWSLAAKVRSLLHANSDPYSLGRAV